MDLSTPIHFNGTYKDNGVLVNNEPDKQKIENFLNDKKLLGGIDKRKISNFIKEDSSNIIKKLNKIFFLFFWFGR